MYYQLGIPTKSSNVMKFGFNDKNLPEIKQEIRKGPCKTTNHVVPCNSNELMQVKYYFLYFKTKLKTKKLAKMLKDKALTL